MQDIDTQEVQHAVKAIVLGPTQPYDGGADVCQSMTLHELQGSRQQLPWFPKRVSGTGPMAAVGSIGNPLCAGLVVVVAAPCTGVAPAPRTPPMRKRQVDAAAGKLSSPVNFFWQPNHSDVDAHPQHVSVLLGGGSGDSASISQELEPVLPVSQLPSVETSAASLCPPVNWS